MSADILATLVGNIAKLCILVIAAIAVIYFFKNR